MKNFFRGLVEGNDLTVLGKFVGNADLLHEPQTAAFQKTKPSTFRVHQPNQLVQRGKQHGPRVLRPRDRRSQSRDRGQPERAIAVLIKHNHQHAQTKQEVNQQISAGHWMLSQRTPVQMQSHQAERQGDLPNPPLAADGRQQVKRGSKGDDAVENFQRRAENHLPRP